MDWKNANFNLFHQLDHYHHGFTKTGFATDHCSIDRPINIYSKRHFFEHNA